MRMTCVRCVLNSKVLDRSHHQTSRVAPYPGKAYRRVEIVSGKDHHAMSDAYTTYEIPVVLSEPPHVGTLELWQSADESPNVQWGLTTSKGFDGIGLTPTVAAQLADMLDQVSFAYDREGEFTVDAVDDDNGEPAWLKGSWDTSGLDLIMVFQTGERRRIVVDDFEDGPINAIVRALRSCSAALAVTQP
jgi:hypothetical protein